MHGTLHRGGVSQKGRILRRSCHGSRNGTAPGYIGSLSRVCAGHHAGVTATSSSESDAAHRLWGGRFSQPSSGALDALNSSLGVDYRLWRYDIRVAKAWVGALQQAGVLTPDESATLGDGLDRVSVSLETKVPLDGGDEDIHTLVERLLYQEVGDLAGKLNTGRSRNDQVVTDLRLWCVDALRDVDAEVAALGRALLGQARRGIDLILPGYTHGQRAQPVRWAHVVLAHAWPLQRDRSRIAQVAERLSELPLGAGALGGSGVGVDREALQQALGFRRVAANSLDVTGSRDFVAEILFVLGLIATDVSRLAGELMTYTSSEYGFIRLADEFCTGSSLMPQKRNPDVLELGRAKAARIVGDLMGVLALVRGLPAGYSKDLQEDKAFLFDAVDHLLLTLPALRGAVETMEPVEPRMTAALDTGLLATDLADGLVNLGIPFREAHRLVGKLVAAAESLGDPITSVPAETAQAIHAALPDLIEHLGSWEESVERRATVGGSSRRSVTRQLEELEKAFNPA